MRVATFNAVPGNLAEAAVVRQRVEFTSRHFLAWCERQGIELMHIQPGRPMQNGYLESFNGRLRDECLNANWFANLAEAKEKIKVRRKEYNTERPHSRLGYHTPEEFARQCSEPASGMVGQVE